MYGYDSGDRVTAITDKNASSATLSSYDYQYDNANRVTQETWSSTTSTGTLSGTNTYGYDASSQVTQDNASTYTYDRAGNQSAAGYTTGTGNELTTDGTYNYTYDNVGNLTQKVSVSGTVTWTYGYNVANELTSVVEESSGTTVLQATYTYDVLGRMVQESEWQGGVATVTRFAYDDNGNVWAELSSSNVVQTRYLYGPGTDEVLARTDVAGGGTAYWYFTDDDGSVRDVVASVLEHIEYDAFGVITLETSPAYGGNVKWTGEWRDPGTGLQYNEARWYDPASHRWLSDDPSGFRGGSPNLYEYGGNDPTNATDPTGLDTIIRSSGGRPGSLTSVQIHYDNGTSVLIGFMVPGTNNVKSLDGYVISLDAVRAELNSAWFKKDAAEWLKWIRQNGEKAVVGDPTTNLPKTLSISNSYGVFDPANMENRRTGTGYATTLAIVGIYWAASGPVFVTGNGSRLVISRTGEWVTENGVKVTPAEAEAASQSLAKMAPGGAGAGGKAAQAIAEKIRNINDAVARGEMTQAQANAAVAELWRLWLRANRAP